MIKKLMITLKKNSERLRK